MADRLRDTANGRLLDAGIRHAVYLHRYGNGLVRSMVGFLNDEVFPDLLGRLEARLSRINLRGYDSGPWTTKRYAGLLADTASILRDGATEAGKMLSAEARKLAKAEANWARASLERATSEMLTFRGLDLRMAASALDQPIHGRPLDQWFRDLSADAARRVQTQVAVGLAQSETTEQIVRRVRGTQANGFSDGALQTTRHQAEALVRTVVNHASTQTREATYAENADVIKGVRWVSTLDTRTSEICISRDGQVYPVGEGPRPPAHPNCRSTTVPVTRSLREILGRGADSAPESTRASMDGQVPASLTYGDWLDQQDAAVQDAVLGRGKGRLWRAGAIAAKDLITSSGRVATLAELTES